MLYVQTKCSHIFLQNDIKDFVSLYPTVYEVDIFSDEAGQHF